MARLARASPSAGAELDRAERLAQPEEEDPAPGAVKRQRLLGDQPGGDGPAGKGGHGQNGGHRRSRGELAAQPAAVGQRGVDAGLAEKLSQPALVTQPLGYVGQDETPRRPCGRAQPCRKPRQTLPHWAVNWPRWG